jgi:hypothetical protein
MKDLLLLLGHYPFSQSTTKTLARLLNEVKDWDVFVKLVNAHGITALAAYNLKESGLDKVIPSDAMSFLEKGHLQSVVRNSWLTSRWKEANEILTKAGIKHILLKGMALEHTLYGSRGLRQMNDNDILIKREDALNAWILMKERGFRSKPLKSPLHNKILPDLGKHLPELYKDGYSLEIHTRLFDEDSQDLQYYNNIFENSPQIKIDNIEAYILPHDINISFLVKHFNYHKMEGDCQLRLYTDIKLLDPDNPLEFPESFVMEPIQKSDHSFRKKSYQNAFRTIPDRYKLRFLIGDIFPTLSWMKERYRCGGFGALMRYPARVGKAFWLIGR